MDFRLEPFMAILGPRNSAAVASLGHVILGTRCPSSDLFRST